MPETVTRSGFIALLGRPNVGKSTLMNALVGEKVAIVSPKPQTTRSRITGVLTRGDSQMIFVDTPGIHSPRTKLGTFMTDTVTKTINDVDIAVVVIDASDKPHQNDEELIDDLKKKGIPTVLVLNKIDLLGNKESMMPRISRLSRFNDFKAVVPLSAISGDGVSLLIDELDRLLPGGPAYFPAETFTDQPERVLAAEMIREKLLYALDDELPHGIGVVVDVMKEREDGVTDIFATVYCEKNSHKGMVIGKDGGVLKEVGTAARRDIEAFLGCRVNLKLWVKVKQDWRNREGALSEMGYVKR